MLWSGSSLSSFELRPPFVAVKFTFDRVFDCAVVSLVGRPIYQLWLLYSCWTLCHALFVQRQVYIMTEKYCMYNRCTLPYYRFWPLLLTTLICGVGTWATHFLLKVNISKIVFTFLHGLFSFLALYYYEVALETPSVPGCIHWPSCTLLEVVLHLVAAS